MNEEEDSNQQPVNSLLLSMDDSKMLQQSFPKKNLGVSAKHKELKRLRRTSKVV
jgi:hypothetical protein